MFNEKIKSYCDQLKAYRKTQVADIILHRKKTQTSHETALMLSETELKIITKNKQPPQEITLELNSGIITVNNHHMPQDYSEEFLLNLENILNLLSTKDTQVYNKTSKSTH